MRRAQVVIFLQHRHELVVTFGRVFEQRRPVLVLAALHPVSIDLEGRRIDRLAQESRGVRVATDVVAVERGWVAMHALDVSDCHHSNHRRLKCTLLFLYYNFNIRVLGVCPNLFTKNKQYSKNE